ncbi:MAG: endonuclease/exonuclease/phosphatase family protein [Acidimicrobiia bacterium]
MVVIVLFAVLLALATVTGFAGGFWWVLDVVANFRVQYLVALTLLGLVLLVGRRWRWGLVATAGAAVNLAVILPLYLAPPASAPPGTPVLRVVSFNLFAANERYQDLIGFLRVVDADVVLLHEASLPWEEALTEADLDYSITRSRREQLIFGTLVLAPGGAQVSSFGFAAEEPRAVEVTTELAGEVIRILGVHPLAPTTEPRAAFRDAQLANASQWAASQNVPAAVVGDLNATPWSYPFRRMLADGGLRDSQQGFGLQASFPVSPAWARVPIDHLLHTPDVIVVDRFLGPDLGSDHFPLVVDLALDLPAGPGS